MKRVLGSPLGTSGALGRTLCSRLSKCSRKRLRISFPVIRGWFSLWGEALSPPNRPLGPDIADAVVEPVLAVLPELDPARPQRVAAPVVAKRHLVREPRVQVQHGFLKHGPRPHDPALAGGEGGELRSPGPAGEVLRRRGPR